MRKFAPFVYSLFLLLFYCSQPQRQPDEVRLRLTGDPVSLNPVNYQNAGALQIINLMFQSLLTVDLADETLKPALAAALPAIVQQDSLTYFTYRLREDAEWTDGSPVTAADVAFTLKVLKAPLVNNEQFRPQVEFIQDIRLTSPTEFTLICRGYTPEMKLLTGDFFILPEYLFDPQKDLQSFTVAELAGNTAHLEQNDQLKRFAAHFNNADFVRNRSLMQGSAGYLLDQWSTGQVVTLTRKDNWWGKNTGEAAAYLTANPKRISYHIIPDNTTALLALKNRQLDVLENIAATEFDQLKQNDGFLADFTLHTPTVYDYTFAGLNTRSSKFSDKYTRQAIAHLLDADNFISATLNNYATRTVGPVPPKVSGFYNKELPLYQFDPKQAEALLKAAGWLKENNSWHRQRNGRQENLTIEICYRAGNTVFENTALIFKQHAAGIGIPVTTTALESNILTQKLKAHEFDMYLRSLSGNPFVFNFKPLFHSSFAAPGGTNYTGFGSPESDALLDAINAARNDQEKAQLLKRLQAKLHDEAAIISLYYQKGRIAVHKRFANTKISGLKPNYDASAFLVKD